MELTTSVRPRILLLSTAYLPLIGGSELAIHHIAERLTNYDFDLITGRYDSSAKLMETVGRIRVFRAGGRLARISLVLPKLFLPFAIATTALRLMRSHQYVAVHAYQVSQAAGAAWLVKLFKPSTPLVITIQEGKNLEHQSVLVRFVRSVLLRKADVVTAISEHLAAYARRHHASAVCIIPNGVDVAAMSMPNIPRNLHRVVTISRLVEKNNVANLIRAMTYVRAQVPDATLTVVGSGKLLGHFRSLVSELRLSETVEFAGSVEHGKLVQSLASAGVFARPSLSEGLGSAFLEAMAARTPVVASAVGGIPDIVHNEETGLICNPNNSEDIARAIVRLMMDASLREHIISHAYTMVREKYDWSMIAKQMGSVYEGMRIFNS